MNISLGMVDWEGSYRSAPSKVGRRLAIALSIVTLVALALGGRLAPPDSKQAGANSPSTAEVAFDVE